MKVMPGDSRILLPWLEEIQESSGFTKSLGKLPQHVKLLKHFLAETNQ